MDDLSRPENGYENPGRNEPAVSNKEAAIQSALDNLQYLKEKEFYENASKFNFCESAGAREALHSTRIRCDNFCSSVHSEVPQFSPSVEDSRGFNTLDIYRNHSDPYGGAVNSSNPTNYWNTSASNFILKNGTYSDHTKYKPEILGKSAKDYSTDSKQDINYDETLELNASSQMGFPNRAVTWMDAQQFKMNYDLSQIARNTKKYNVPVTEAIGNKDLQGNIYQFQGPLKDNAPVTKVIRNNESQESINKFQVPQMDISSVNKVFWNYDSKGNIYRFQRPQKDDAPANEAIQNSESHWNISQIPGPQKDNAPVNKVFWNKECQGNIYQFQGSKDQVNVKTADAGESVKESAHSRDDILAIPGPSRFHGNLQELNVPDDKLQSRNASEIQRVVPKKVIQCLYCGEGVDKHTKIYLKRTEYFCCACEYKTSETHNYLQEHIRIHCSKIKCNECLKEYTEGNSHVGQQICKLCSLTFECRTQLDEHLLKFHLEHFRKNCWECFEPVSAHYTRKDGKKNFFCCMCGFETNHGLNILFHNDKHRLKFFCKICKEEYTNEQKVCHNSKYTFINCYKEFKCRNQLEDHYQEDPSCVEHFSKHCRFCNGEIKKHGEKFYYCCKCQFKTGPESKFKAHLHTHTGLTIFKCGKCDKRYQYACNLSTHTKKLYTLYFFYVKY